MNDTPPTTPPVDPADPSVAADLTPTAAERRDALRKLGVMAALTPPTILTLLLSRRATAESPVLGEPGPDP
jgi:hypothetical protein